MAIKMDVRVRTTNMHEVVSELRAGMERAALAAARGAAAEAKNESPVDTGALQESIRVEQVDKASARVVAGGGGVVNPKHGRVVDYAAVVEADHPTHAGFLRRAIMRSKARLADMAGPISAAFARAARRRLGYATARARGASTVEARRRRDTRQARVVQP